MEVSSEVVVGGQDVAKVVEGRKDPLTSRDDSLVVFGGGMEVSDSEVVVGGREVVRWWKENKTYQRVAMTGWWSFVGQRWWVVVERWWRW